jgi:hypothetical protein
MADYHPLILRAVEGLDKNTSENRRALYERARTALVAQLRGVSPALDESEITRERLALEEAIRKVEAEAARRAREEPRRQPPPRPAPQRPAAPPASPPRQAAPPPPPPPPVPVSEPDPWADLEQSSRELQPPPDAAPSSSLTDEAVRGYRDAMSGQPSEPPPSTRLPRQPQTFDQQPPAAPRQPARSSLPKPQEFDRSDPRQQTRYERDVQRRPPPQQQPPVEDQWAPPPEQEAPPSFEFSEPPPPPPRPRRAEQRVGDPPPAPRLRIGLPQSYRKYVTVGLIALLGIALGGLAFWQRDAIGSAASGLIAMVSGGGSKPAAPATTTPQQKPKITDRLGGPQTDPAGAPAVAQRVVLYEEDPNDPQGKRLLGTAVWRTEMMSPAPGRPAELAVRADITVPERKMTMTFTLRRNADASLPASHTIEIMFNLPADAPHGGVQNVPGLLMKQSEQTRGVPLAGLAVKVTPGFFLIGLSSLESDMQRNIQLLKERGWFDIPMVYANNRRAILAIEKGTPGERAFQQAFAAWKQ